MEQGTGLEVGPPAAELLVRHPYSLLSYTNEHRCGIARVVRRLSQWFEPDAWNSIDAELSGTTTLVAVDDRDRVIGFVVVRVESEERGRITWAGVDPDYHRCGVGRALVEMIVEEASAAGLKRLMVETMSGTVEYEPFRRTRAFYAAVGFEPVCELGDLAGNGLATTDWALDIPAELAAH